MASPRSASDTPGDSVAACAGPVPHHPDAERRSTRLVTAKGHLARLARSSSGAVLVEAALCLPPVILLLFGILSYGSWFMAAHTIEQAADEGARAALAGLSASERLTLVNQSVAQVVAAGPGLNPANVTTTAASAGGFYTVTVNYRIDAGLMAVGPIPPPSTTIRRSSSIRLNAL